MLYGRQSACSDEDSGITVGSLHAILVGEHEQFVIMYMYSGRVDFSSLETFIV